MLQWTWGCRYLFQLVFLFSLDKCPEVELLDCMVASLLIFCGTSILFSIVAAPIYMPTNSAQRFSFLHFFTNTCYFLVILMIAILTGLMWYLIVVLICIFLMISNIERLFMCLSALCMCSLEKCLFRIHCPFFQSDFFLLYLLM